jgi:predicted O-linked N-acetylglucosamine transferase (SPINDLY family)
MARFIRKHGGRPNLVLRGPQRNGDAFKRALKSYQAGHFDKAEAFCRAVLHAKADHFDALCLLAVAQSRLGRLQDALASYDNALAIKPEHPEVLNNRGITLRQLKRFDEALANSDRALAIKPDYAEALNNRAIALRELKRFDEALASYDKALAIKPDYAEAWNNRGNVLGEVKRFEDAVTSYDRALKIDPDNADALYNRGDSLQRLKRLQEALASYEKALAIQPDHPGAFGALAGAARQICDWTRTAALEGEIRAHVEQGKSIVPPFTLLGYSSDAALQLKAATSYIQSKLQIAPEPLWNGTIYRHDKVRIAYLAYLSADFHRHATAYLMAELFELHDRKRFEVIGVSFGAEDRSDIRARIVKSFDQFHDVRLKTDREVAKLLSELQVDIAIDLMGYTREGRPEILAHRPAPIQVSYIGYPGTQGAPFIDYVIADSIVLPFDQEPFYTEKIIQLPDCYQANDSRRRIAERTPTRREIGLPEHGVVFCCFNNNYKITPPVFEIWMRLLRAVEGSVLWLLADNAVAQNNLRGEAASRGIDPARLVFAGRLPVEEHLARHRLADVFLDTLPVNAHTTASDALWAGLPLITCRGKAFAGRVAASLLNAVGLPELVTTSLDEYEALALQLASDASLLQSIRAKLAQNRLRSPLFDTDRFRRHIETAYLTAWEIWQRGESPRSFRVEAAR